MTVLGPFGFAKGLNTKAASNTIAPNQMSDAQNIRLIEGDLVKITGSRTLNATPVSGNPAVTGIADWQTAAGQRYQVVAAGPYLLQTADLATSFTDITGTTSITPGARATFASLNNQIVRCAGTDAPITWNGTGNATTLTGSPPAGNICTTVNNFMFIAGTAANPSRVNWSNIVDPTVWPATAYVDFRKNDGDKITALASLDYNLIIFKRNSIGKMDTSTQVISGFATLGALTTSVNGCGCVGPLSLDNLPDGKIVFMAPNAHVYVYDGVVCHDISDQDLPESNIQTLLNNLVSLQNTVIRYYPTRQEIWVSGTQSGNSTNNIVFIYDYAKDCWSCRLTNTNINVMCTALDTRATINHSVVLLTGNYAGQVYEQDFGNENAEASGTVIDGYGTACIQFSGQGTDFVPRSALVPLEYQGAWNLQFNYGYNDYTNTQFSKLLSLNVNGAVGLDTFVLDTNTLVGNAPLRRVVVLNSSNMNASIQVQFRNTYADQPFTIHPFYISDEVMI